MILWTFRHRPKAALFGTMLGLALVMANGFPVHAQDNRPSPIIQPESGPQAGEPPSGIPAPPSIIQPAEIFGDAVEIPARTIIYLKGKGNLESDYPTLRDAFKTVEDYVSHAGIKPVGPPMLIYLEGEDSSFEFHAAVPVAEAPKEPPKGDLAVGPSPSGKMLKFVHQGSYESMDMTYEAIKNFLDGKGLDADELFIEEYVTDPVTTSPDDLTVNILVPAH